MIRLIRLITSALPFVIIGGLLYAALFIKPRVIGASVTPPPIQARDAFYGVASPTEAIVWAVGRNAKIVRSDDSGRTWQVQQPAKRVNLQAILAWDAKRAIVVGNAGSIMRTEDGGSTWQDVSGLPDSISASKLVRIKRLGEGLAVATGELGAVLLSVDAGKNWKSIGKQEDISWNDVSVAGDAWIVVGEFGHIRRSTDRGTSWQDISSPVKTSLNAIAFRDALQGVAVGLDGVILATWDGGLSWTQLRSPVHEHLFDVLANGRVWVASGDQGLILASADDGDWTARRVSERDYAWRTDVELSGDKLLLAGANLGVFDAASNTFQRFK